MADVDLWTLFAAYVAVVIAIVVGFRIAEARDDVTVQLLNTCAEATHPIAEVMTCGTGAMVWFVVPGVIGVFVIVFSALR